MVSDPVVTLICYTKIYTKNPFCNYSEHYFTHKTAPCATLFFVGFSLVFIGLYGRCLIMADVRYLGRCAMFPSTARHSHWGDNAPQLLQAPPDLKHRTPPYSPLRGLTFVERAMFLTGSSKAFRFTLLHDAPQSHSPAPATGNKKPMSNYNTHRYSSIFPFLFLSGGKNMPAKPNMTKYAIRNITIILHILPKESANL